MANILIVDYGMGNRRSVEKALRHIGADAVITADHAQISAADAIVLPGVGAFPKGMAPDLPKKLAAENVYAAPRLGRLRISPHVDCTPEDLTRLRQGLLALR